jgi:hypothetical protein
MCCRQVAVPATRKWDQAGHSGTQRDDLASQFREDTGQGRVPIDVLEIARTGSNPVTRTLRTPPDTRGSRVSGGASRGADARPIRLF